MEAFTRRAHERRDAEQSQAAPGAVPKTMQDIMPGTSWSTRPSCAMVASTFNVSTSESLGRRWPRGTETLKLRRAVGRTEALVVVQITLVGEVEPIAPDCSLSARAGIEGAVLAYEKIVCSNGACPNFRLCHPVGVEPGTRIRVLEVGQELECPLGYSLVSAKVGYGN